MYFVSFAHSSKVQCSYIFYEIVLLPFIKLNTINKVQLKYLDIFKGNFSFFKPIFPLFGKGAYQCFYDVMMKLSFVGVCMSNNIEDVKCVRF